MTEDALQVFPNEKIEYKEAMSILTRIDLTISQSLTQSQETLLVITKQLQLLQAHTSSNKPSTEKLETDKKQHLNKSKSYCWTHGRIRNIYHTILTCPYPNKGHHFGKIMENRMGGIGK